MRKQLPPKSELIKKGMLLAGFPIAGTVLLSVLYRKTACKVFLPLAISFGTTSYHVAMRLLVGLVKLFLKIAELDADRLCADKLEVNLELKGRKNILPLDSHVTS